MLEIKAIRKINGLIIRRELCKGMKVRGERSITLANA
jgi:hypothetical protein